MIEDSVILPDVRIGTDVVLRKVIVDKHCVIQSGERIGLDPERDRKRFHVTERGVTLVTPDRLGQLVHATR
jgi:glucose-1-phosphate adenylyltransferase